jgi:hypothetical protein
MPHKQINLLSMTLFKEDNKEHHRLLDRIKAVLGNISNSQQKDNFFQIKLKRSVKGLYNYSVALR